MNAGTSRADDRPSILSKMAALLWLLFLCSILMVLDVLALINIPYSIYYVFIFAEVLHYSNIKLYIKYQFHPKRIDLF